MAAARLTARRMTLDVAVFACLVLLGGGFAFVSRDFGFRAGVVLSLLLVLPLVVAVRLRRRMPAVRGREVVFLAVLFCVAAGGGGFLVRAWYAADGLDRNHAENVKWAEFERRLRRDPAFREVQVNKTRRKNIHWASGTVASENDLDRLRSLAAECGIEGRLDGPYAHSVSLTVRPQPRG